MQTSRTTTNTATSASTSSSSVYKGVVYVPNLRLTQMLAASFPESRGAREMLEHEVHDISLAEKADIIRVDECTWLLIAYVGG